MSNEVNEYLTFDELKSEATASDKDKDISKLEQIKERLPEGTQKDVMDRIIHSAKNDSTEIPKVINLVEIPEISKESERKENNATDDIRPTDADSINSKSRFIRKKINFNALDELYLEEASHFVQNYRENHKVVEEVPKRLPESYVEEVLGMPITNEEKPSVVCAVPFLEIQSIGLPEDKVLTALNEEMKEDALFSFITMHPYDSEKGDFIYSEENIEVISSEYPISL